MKGGDKMVKKKDCCADWNKRIKNFNYMDLGKIKLASITFVLFLIAIWPGFTALVHKIHWGWFLAAFVIFSMGPMKRFFK